MYHSVLMKTKRVDEPPFGKVGDFNTNWEKPDFWKEGAIPLVFPKAVREGGSLRISSLNSPDIVVPIETEFYDCDNSSFRIDSEEQETFVMPVDVNYVGRDPFKSIFYKNLEFNPQRESDWSVFVPGNFIDNLLAVRNGAKRCKKDSHEVAFTVKLEVSSNYLRLAWTDTYRLVIGTYPCDGQEVSVVLDAFPFYSVKPVSAESWRVSGYIEEDYVYFLLVCV